MKLEKNNTFRFLFTNIDHISKMEDSYLLENKIAQIL